MNQSIRYLACDTETGGLGPDVSLLTAHLMILDSGFRILEELPLAIKPDNHIYHVTAEALKINKINLIEHEAASISSGKAGELFLDLIKRHSDNGKNKLIPLGHNVIFDMEKLYDNILNKKTAQTFVSYRVLDTGSAGRFLITCGALPSDISGSLESYVKHFKISPGEYHTARGDILMTVEVMRHMIFTVQSQNIVFNNTDQN